MPPRHGVRAEDVDGQLPYQSLQKRPSLRLLEIECDRLLADVRCDEVAVTIVARHRPTDETVRISTGDTPRYRRLLDPDHPVA